MLRVWCGVCVTCEDNMWLEILFHDLFSQTSQALREEVGSEYIQLFWNTSITYVPTALSSKTDIMKETEQDLSLVFQNCPSPTQTNFTNSSGRLEDHNDLRTELSSLAIHQPDRPDRGRNWREERRFQHIPAISVLPVVSRNKLLSLLGNIVAGRSVRLEILCIMRGTIKDLLLLSQNLQWLQINIYGRQRLAKHCINII